MKPHCSNQRNRALTLVEVLVVIVIIVLLVAILLPSLARTKRGSFINCVNNLKQVGLSFRIWSGDNFDKYPMEISVANGGAMELLNTPDAWKVFQVMSNELSTPKVLVCPLVAEQMGFTNWFATNFSADLKNHISYFIGLDASKNSPQALLAGDDNLEISGEPVKTGLLELSTNTPIAWTSGRHTTYKAHFWTSVQNGGNICLTDGSVQQLSNAGLKNQLQQTGLATNRLAIP